MPHIDSAATDLPPHHPDLPQSGRAERVTGIRICREERANPLHPPRRLSSFVAAFIVYPAVTVGGSGVRGTHALEPFGCGLLHMSDGSSVLLR